MKRKKLSTFTIAVAACLFSIDVLAQSLDLVGRGNEFTVTEKDGSVTQLDASRLSINRAADTGSGMLPDIFSPDARGRGTVTDARTGETSEGTVDETGAAEPQKPVTSETATEVPDSEAEQHEPDAPTQSAPKEGESEAVKAARAADVDELRKMRDQGGAYFYDVNRQPISFDELERRIQTGEVEGIQAIGLHLQDWSPTVTGVKEAEKNKAAEDAAKAFTDLNAKSEAEPGTVEPEPESPVPAERY